jgi:DNA-3-methyladenine glycosylase
LPVPLPQSFFARPAEVVAPELIGCLLVKRQADGDLLCGVIVETEAYSQDDPACHGYRRRTPSNETLFGEPGRFYVYVSYGIHHCVKRAVTSKTAGCAWDFSAANGSPSQPPSHCPKNSQIFPPRDLPQLRRATSRVGWLG